MRNFIAGAVAAVVVLAVITFGYLGSGLLQVGADSKPPAWQTGLMYSGVHASVRREAPEMQNPLPATDETTIAGGKLYVNDCIGCHGTPGGSPSKFGTAFYPEAPQFPFIGTQYSEAQLFWIATHGIRRTGMVPQGYSDTDSWRLTAFIARAKSLSPGVLQAISAPSK